MWYSDSYRRHLCDMHIEDWSEQFLSAFSVEDYVQNLKTANIQNAMIYLQSHVGLCNFPTKTGHMHKAFIGNEDKMKRLIDLCHKNNILVTGYYSLNYNTIEHDMHPDWQMKTLSGKSRREGGISDGKALDFASVRKTRYGFCCPNNPDYRNFVYAQIKEMTVNTVIVNEKTVAPIISPFEIRVKTAQEPKSVTLLPENESINFRFENGYTVFNTRELKIFDMYRIQK